MWILISNNPDDFRASIVFFRIFIYNSIELPNSINRNSIKMNKELWDKVEAFQLDKWTDEYGFVLRLAKENLWTKNFTALAILEYKKFMYLAATSNQMVSPSEIVDIVWHQHLIFTQSYNEFCKLLGKDIQHIPSTHNRSDYEKFRQAKELTTKLYNETFGEQPASIWEYSTMYDTLKLKKANKPPMSIIRSSVITFFVLIPFAFFVLRPVYIHISSTAFMFFFIFAFIAAIVLIQRYNQSKIYDIIKYNSSSSFIFDLHPYELLYLNHKDVKEGVIATFNELIEQRNIKIGAFKNIEYIHDKIIQNREQAIVLKELRDTDVRSYLQLIDILKRKTVFTNQKTSMQQLLDYLLMSNKFNQVLIVNILVLGGLTFLTLMRVIIGISRDKPILFISILTVVIALCAVGVIGSLMKIDIPKGITKFYSETIIPKKQKENWQWSYVLGGNTALEVSLLSLVILANTQYAEKSNLDSSSDSSSNSCSSDSGSSCGSDSSCGSSCGGCGGGGD